MRKFKDITGEKFGYLTVVGQDDFHISESGYKVRYWKCLCDCGNLCSVSGSHLKNGHTKSCGCLQKKAASETATERLKKYNRFEECGDYMIGYTQDEKPFYISKEDYDKVKDYCWFVANRGYIKAKVEGKTIFLHRFIMNPQEGMFVDHINHRHEDNRRINLRIVTHSQNMRNAKRTNKTSGHVGVYWVKNKNRWCARIDCNGKTKYAGFHKNLEDAIAARENLEKEYFGEYSYESSMAIAEENDLIF